MNDSGSRRPEQLFCNCFRGMRLAPTLILVDCIFFFLKENSFSLWQSFNFFFYVDQKTTF